MRPDRLRLRDIEEAAEAIQRFLAGVEERTFLENELLQSAVLQKLTVIGEAAARVSRKLRGDHPEIEWRTIVGLRNIVVHEYFAVGWESVWETARSDIPRLLLLVRQLIEEIE